MTYTHASSVTATLREGSSLAMGSSIPCKAVAEPACDSNTCKVVEIIMRSEQKQGARTWICNCAESNVCVWQQQWR